MVGRVLVTGATGSLGPIVVRMLLDHHRSVRATGRNVAMGRLLIDQGAEFVPCDLIKGDLAPLCKDCDTIFHLAGLSSPWGDDIDFELANITATHRLLQAAQQEQCRRFIFTSTPSIYSVPKDQFDLREDTPLPRKFLCTYSRTKYEAENLVRQSNQQNFTTSVIRPRAIISPYDTALLPRLIRGVKNGKIPLPHGGKALIEVTDARDVAEALLTAERHMETIGGYVFNISGGEALPLQSIVSTVFSILEKPVRIISIPRRLAMLGASMMEMVCKQLPGRPEPILTRYTAAVLGWSQTFDLSMANQMLGWAPQYCPSEAIKWALSERNDA